MRRAGGRGAGRRRAVGGAGAARDGRGAARDGGRGRWATAAQAAQALAASEELSARTAAEFSDVERWVGCELQAGDRRRQCWQCLARSNSRCAATPAAAPPALTPGTGGGDSRAPWPAAAGTCWITGSSSSCPRRSRRGWKPTRLPRRAAFRSALLARFPTRARKIKFTGPAQTLGQL